MRPTTAAVKSSATSADSLGVAALSTYLRARGPVAMTLGVLACVAVLASTFVPSGRYFATGSDPVPITRTSRHDGRLDFATARTVEASWFAVAVWRIRGTVSPVEEIAIEPGRDPLQERRGVKIDQVGDVPTLAYLAAEAAAGRPKRRVTGSGVLVVSSMPDAPLQPGDVITSAAGRRITQLDDLDAVIAAWPAQHRIPVRLADGRVSELRVLASPGTRSGYESEQTLRTAGLRVTPPLPPLEDAVDANVHGSSYGLALALHYYEQLTGEDLVRGRHVVATGEIKETGEVAPVSLTGLKASASAAAGADLLLVPEAVLPATYRYGAYESMYIAPVMSLADAIRELRRPWPES